MGDKATVKKCSVGKNVTIRDGAKITGCILMDGVVIGEGSVHISTDLFIADVIIVRAKLDSCIVGPNARIGANAVLSKCNVGSKCEVSPNGESQKSKVNTVIEY